MKIDILSAVAVAVAVAVEFVGSVSPVVGGFVPWGEGYRHYPQLCTGHELVHGYAFGHCASGIVVSGPLHISWMLLKTPDNRDQGRIIQRVEKELWAKADAVLYGFFGAVIKELMRGLMVVLMRHGNHETFRVASVRDTAVSRGPAWFSGFVLFTFSRRFVARRAEDFHRKLTYRRV